MHNNWILSPENIHFYTKQGFVATLLCQYLKKNLEENTVFELSQWVNPGIIPVYKLSDTINVTKMMQISLMLPQRLWILNVSL